MELLSLVYQLFASAAEMRFSLIDAEYSARSNSRSNNPDPADPADPERDLRFADGALYSNPILFEEGPDV